MELTKRFESLCNNVELDNRDDLERSAGEIAKKLNKEYYALDADASTHLYIVGSVGRETAIKGNSDLDIIFDLPEVIYKRFDAYESNGQSALLQEIKNCLLTRYPKTDMSGDGQVVVIEFEKYTVELVPGFKRADGSFLYPDTHDEGKWKVTNPLAEQKESATVDKRSQGTYRDICRIIRCWRNTQGFRFGGLLIDTLVYNHFKEHDFYKNATRYDYLDILKNLWKYLSEQHKDKEYWHALGSNQLVRNSGKGTFVTQAKKALEQLNNDERNGEDINIVLRELLGRDYPAEQSELNESQSYRAFRNTEQFIQDLFPVDIRYALAIDCNVSQDGFRRTLLSKMIREGLWLRHNKLLEFYISYEECPKPYSIYWKIRNVGEEAEKRDQIRGQIKLTDRTTQIEHTDFRGSHYAECYLVKNGICVARAHIDVPIGY